MLEILNDKELVESYRNGNVASFELLVERHQNKVFSYDNIQVNSFLN